MIRSHAQHESMHVLHAKARARMLIISGSLKAANRLVCFSRVCSMCALPLTRPLTHTAPSHHESNLIRTSDTRSLRPCTLSTNIYIVNPEPESLKPEDYARIDSGDIY